MPLISHHSSPIADEPIGTVAARVRSTLENAKQAHLLQPAPSPERAENFFREVDALDLAALRETFDRSMRSPSSAVRVAPFESVVHLEELSDADATRNLGLELIAEGKVAALLLAGGQGTRLGSSAPKGCYDIGLPSHKSLFQYHAEKVLAVSRLAGKHAGKPAGEIRLPLLIMTSDATNAVTYDFFVANGFFGLAESQVILFEQDMLPCMSLEGNLLLSAPGELAKAPNGNGGVYVSLQRLGILERLKTQGVTSIFQFGVDNLLCHVADPLFVGFCHERDADCGVKTVGKRDPHEKVGVLALTNGNASVVEYSEISKEMAEARDSEGRIVYGASHICVNWFSMAFLERFCATMLDHLPLHVAKKKIPTCTPEGGAYTPDAPNGVKLELFIFDSFPLADKVIALQVPREEEFAPVKNAAGAPSDSPDTARRLVSNLCRARITAAGATILDTDASDGILEISPLVSYSGEGLERFRGRELQLPLEITPDTP